VALVQEITEEWLAREREQEFRQRLVTALNHELRTPVAKLTTNLELLAEIRDDLPSWAQTALGALARTTEQLDRLSGTVAQLIELEAAATVVPIHQDVVPILRALETDLRDLLEENDVRLELDVPDALRATVDRAGTRRALREIVRNGVRLAPPGSVIPLTARIEEQSLVVTVGDDWSRLSDEDRLELLEPFSRGVSGPAFSSVGLGLAYARVIANAMGGDLTLEPNASGGTDAIWHVNRYGERGQMRIPRLRAR
jgi:K+-sensing histidine kinase KdpD